MDNFRDSYFQVDWDLTTKRLKGTYWGKQYDTGRGFAVTVINGGQVVAPTTEALRLKWEKPDNTTGYVNATIVDGKFIVENIDQMFTVHGSVRADFELSVGGKFVASITFYVNVEKAVAVDAVASSSQFTALQDAVGSVDSLQQQFNNVVANVTVDSEVIAARGTETTLGARLDSTEQDYTQHKLDYIAHKEDYKDIINKSPNLFNKQSVTLGYTFSGSTGNPVANPLYFISDFIEVEKLETYNRSHNMMVTRYNENLDFLSVAGFNTTPVSTGNATYVRLAGFIDDISHIQFEKGNVATPYREYDKIIIDKLSISSANLNEDLASSLILDMENILHNGTFIEGISDWVPLTSPESFTIVNGMAELDMMDNYSSTNGIAQPVELIKGDKYHVITRAKTDDTIANIQLRAYATTIDSRVSTGEFEIFSGVFDAENQSDIRVRVVYPSVEDTTDKKLTVDYVLLINLTEFFGRGNEPNKKDMDSLITGIGPFEGKYVLSKKQIFQEILSKINTNGDQGTNQGFGYIVNPDISEYTGQAMITLSYDDGYLNNHFLALPIHEKHGIPATFNIPANRPITESYHDMFFNSLIVRECHERGVEIASHAYNHGKYTEQSDEDIHWDMAESIRVLDLITGVPTETIAIPNSAYDSRVENIAKQYFKGVRVYGDELNDLPVTNRYHLKSAIAITNVTTITQVKNIIDNAISQKKWAILMFHNIKNAPIGDRSLYATTPQLLDSVLGYINEQGRDTLLPVNTRDGLKFSLGENY